MGTMSILRFRTFLVQTFFTFPSFSCAALWIDVGDVDNDTLCGINAHINSCTGRDPRCAFSMCSHRLRAATHASKHNRLAEQADSCFPAYQHISGETLRCTQTPNLTHGVFSSEDGRLQGLISSSSITRTKTASRNRPFPESDYGQ